MDQNTEVNEVKTENELEHLKKVGINTKQD